MALFENFPYTNLHELNLDWLINQIKEMQESQVLSVNGETGAVILYEDAIMQLPNVTEDHWSIIRMANGTTRGIMFGNDNTAYIVHGNLMAQIYSVNNPPPYPVTSVNGQTGDIVLYSSNATRLPDINDINIHNWNIFRELNNVFRGIQFNDDGTTEIIDGLNRYQLYTVNNPPPYPVISVNGQTGNIVLYTDNNGSIGFPEINDPNLAGWIIKRSVNGVVCYLGINDDGTVDVSAGGLDYHVYTEKDTENDIINIPNDANTDIWGLIRTTAEGSVGILFDNNDNLIIPEAYIRYVDSNNVVHTEKLLTANDIPSSSGVVSFNGQTGVVVIKGSDLIVSTTDTRTIAQAITDGSTTDYAIKGCIAYVENTAIATQNIPSGAYVIWQNNDYVSTQAISIGDTLSGSNLTALSAGGITNDLRNDINTLNDKITKETFSLSVYQTRVTNISSSKKTIGQKSANNIVIIINAKVLTDLTSSASTLLIIPNDYVPTGGIEISFPVVIKRSGTKSIFDGTVNFTNGNININHNGLSVGDELYANFSYVI